MMEHIVVVTVLVTFAIYFNYSISLVNLISDEILFNQLTLWQVICRLSLFRKLMLILTLPIVIPIGLILFVIHLLFRLRARR